MTALADSSVLRKAAWRLLPLLCLLYIFNILNRSNVGFAAESMEGQLNITPAQSDWAYGLFYFGYLVFQVPANLLLPRVGARRWIALLVIAWGLTSCATMFVTGPWSLFLARILLGVTQAGFFPGVILYLTFWFPSRERARVVSFFMVAISISGALGNPIHGAIMKYMRGTAGLAGWQWLLLLEGLPTILLGFVVLLVLPDGPERARWLTTDDREWLRNRLDHERQSQTPRDKGSLLRAFLDPQVWLLIGVYFTVAVGTNAAGARYPKLVRSWFVEDDEFTIGLRLALPPLFAIVGMTLMSMHSDYTGERRGHVCFSALLAAAGWLLAAKAGDRQVRLFGLCMAQMGMMSMLPCFWTLPTAYLSPAAAAGGIALINSLGNVGGLLGPRILGAFGLEAMALILAVGGVLVLAVHREQVRGE